MIALMVTLDPLMTKIAQMHRYMKWEQEKQDIRDQGLYGGDDE